MDELKEQRESESRTQSCREEPSLLCCPAIALFRAEAGERQGCFSGGGKGPRGAFLVGRGLARFKIVNIVVLNLELLDQLRDFKSQGNLHFDRKRKMESILYPITGGSVCVRRDVKPGARGSPGSATSRSREVRNSTWSLLL